MNPYRLPSPPSCPAGLQHRVDWVALLWATLITVALLPSMPVLLILLLFNWYSNIYWPGEFRVLLSPRKIYLEIAEERLRRNTVQGPL